MEADQEWHVTLTPRGNYVVCNDHNRPCPDPWRFKTEADARARIVELVATARRKKDDMRDPRGLAAAQYPFGGGGPTMGEIKQLIDDVPPLGPIPFLPTHDHLETEPCHVLCAVHQWRRHQAAMRALEGKEPPA